MPPALASGDDRQERSAQGGELRGGRAGGVVRWRARFTDDGNACVYVTAACGPRSGEGRVRSRLVIRGEWDATGEEINPRIAAA